MKKTIICLSLLLGVSCTNTSDQNNQYNLNIEEETAQLEITKENPINDAVKELLYAFKNKDFNILNQYISKQGVYIIQRDGVFNVYEKISEINEKNVTQFFQNKINIAYSLVEQELPNFSCDTEKWNKTGLFFDEKFNDNILSTTAKNLVEYRGDKIESKTISEFENIDKNSKKIVLVDENQVDFVFYFSLIDNQWFLTIIDMVSSKCGA